MADQALVEKIALSSLKGVSVPTIEMLLSRFGSAQQLLTLPEATIAAALGRRITALSDAARAAALETGRREAEFVANHKVKPLFYTDADYPKRLLNCEDAPIMLYALGNCDLNAARFLAVVGTRHATAAGVKWVEDMVKDLSQMTDNVVIVSGLAYGIDVAGHRAAMANGFPTVSVLAHGLTTLYPAPHRDIAARMVKAGGMLLTEYRSDAAIHRGNFLARNRIVAGLCDGLIVVESAAHGGAMVTARIANDYGREVMAVPGRVSDTYSAGCNRLIANNVAQLITSAEDVAQCLNWPKKPTEGTQATLPLALKPDQQRVVDYIATHEGATQNMIAMDLEMSMPSLLPLLVDLDFAGVILSLPGGRYRLA